tara:strand:+ start:841 stop:1062 length:222 start_codon:yes stop_codon:yes gene_type:complete
MEYRIVELLKEIKGLIAGQEKTANWIDIKEASAYCGCSPSTIRRNVKNNKLKASVRLGKMLFKKSHLEAWLNG